MKVLFVASGNARGFKLVPFVRAQGESLKKKGIHVSYFPITEKGVTGYFRNISKLKAFINRNPPDIIHAHFTLSGWVAILSRPGVPIVLSLMGDDAYGTYVGPGKVLPKSRLLTLLTYLIQPFVQGIIAKSENIGRFVFRKNIAYIVPNGVQLEKFKPHLELIRRKNEQKNAKKQILFLGNKNDKRKNYKLVRQAVGLLQDDRIEILAPYPVEHDQVAGYLNTADVLVLTSFMEGSPNVIKEAMACNCPIVATQVGDVSWVLGQTRGCYIASFQPGDVARKLKLAIEFSEKEGRTEGRNRIKELGLDSLTTTSRIVEVYKEVLRKTNKSGEQSPAP